MGVNRGVWTSFWGEWRCLTKWSEVATCPTALDTLKIAWLVHYLLNTVILTVTITLIYTLRTGAEHYDEVITTPRAVRSRAVRSPFHPGAATTLPSPFSIHDFFFVVFLFTQVSS